MSDQQFHETWLWMRAVAGWAVLVFVILFCFIIIAVNGLPRLYWITSTADAKYDLKQTSLNTRRDIISDTSDLHYQQTQTRIDFLQMCSNLLDAQKVQLANSCLTMYQHRYPPDTSGAVPTSR